MANVVGWPEVVIFDCDGVLVDSEPISMDQTRRALAAAGLDLDEAEAIERFLGRPLAASAREIEMERGVTLPPDFAAGVTAAVLARFETELKAVEGVREAVLGLDAKVCVASSSAPHRIRRSLELTGLLDLFAPNIFSTAMVAHGKPQPDIFLYAARQMQASPAACLVVEDSQAGLQAAARAGMEAFAFVGASHFAPDADLHPVAGAALTFRDMARLPALIASHADGRGAIAAARA